MRRAAFRVQRLTGLALLGYLFLHVHTIRELRNGPAAFNTALATFHSPFFKLLEIGLLGTVILHAVNGARITMMDLGVGLRRQRLLAWGVAAAAVFATGAIPMFLGGVVGR